MFFSKSFFFNLLKLLLKPLVFFIENLLDFFNIIILWRAGPAIGDNLLMAGLARKLTNKSKLKVVIISRYSDVLSNSTYVFKSYDWNKIPFKKITYYFLKIIESKRVIEYMFPVTRYGYSDLSIAKSAGFFIRYDNPPVWRIHVADRFPKEFFYDFIGGLNYSKKGDGTKLVKKLRNYYPQKRIAVINPHGKVSYTRLKQFGFSNYQRIVELTNDEILYIQVGLKKQECLSFIDFDARGEDLLFLIDLIASSDFVLADEGLNNHIAGSFPNVISYVPYSLFSDTEYYSYKNTFVLGSASNIKLIKVKKKFDQDDYPSKYLTDIQYMANQILMNERKRLKNEIIYQK